MDDATPFFDAIANDDRDSVAAMLDEHPTLLDAESTLGVSPLMMAIYGGAGEIVELLRARGAELGACEAAALGNVGRLGELLEQDAGIVTAHSADGWTPLHLAAFFGRIEAVVMLLAAGADIAAWSENATRNQPLHAAIAGANDPAVVDHLIDDGADVTAVAGGGYTPLHLAASRGDLRLIEIFVTRGAIVDARTDTGYTPARLASERGHDEAALRLKELEGTVST